MSSTLPPLGLVVVIVGATGAVGKDLIQALEKSPFPLRELRLVASRRSADIEVSFGGATLPVQVLNARHGVDPVFHGADLVILAVPPDLAADLALPLVAHGLTVVAIGGALADKGVSYLPGLGMDLSHYDHLPLVSTPSAPAAALAAVLSPLKAFGLESARGTVLLSAGLFGRAGLDELSAQVVALFGGGSPPRKVFPGGLAFDLVEPPDGGAGADGWTETELKLARETGALLQLDPFRLSMTVVAAPLFAGLTMSLHLRFSADPNLDELQTALSTAEGLRYGDPVLSPRRLPGRSGVYVGRLRADPLGEGVHLWVAADNLRACAVAPAVGAVQTLWREGRFARD